MTARDVCAPLLLGVAAGLIVGTGLALWGGQVALAPVRWIVDRGAR